MTPLAPQLRISPVAAFAAFALAAAAVAAIVLGEPYLAMIVSPRAWQRLHLLNFPMKGVLLAVAVVAALSLAVYLAHRAPDARTLIVVLMAIGMQTTAIKLVGVNLITVLPFVAILFVVAESLLRPSTPVPLTSVVFFGLALLLLDLPYVANPNIYGPARFVINFASGVKAIAVAIAMVLVVTREEHLRSALRAMVVVGILAALVGVVQIALHKFAGITFSLVAEEHQTKATFFGMTLRASGLTTWSQHLADYLVLVVPFALFQLADAPTSRKRLAWLAALVTMVAAVVFTFTYAGYFALAAIFLMFPFARWPSRSLHFALAIVGALALAYLVGGFDWAMDKYAKYVATSTGMVERRVYLNSTLGELARDPWTGSGFYAEEEFSGNFYRKRVHNTPLQAWADLGLAGLLVFMAMIATLYTQLWLAVAGARDTAWRQRLQALALGMTGTIIAMMAEPNLTAPHTWFMLGLVAAAVRLWSVRTQEAPAP
ncbi:MAG TPA: O-antigen ligase family protein [Usitatibacter sp.]|nr:O-antigen ligase family protein [Usitatibacter sp.]